ncbi:hypothetical protein EUTSA_v10012489mg [Eutrema salsugineum]|uniref:ADP-ribosyl cyclase/cyclic ADP-ribose hydrolase n=1 Tax=Eutrema salsugineum TaxID=72664 RepID=V4LBN3_EUTSA|nr:disease resistance protein TAO1 [Eutrema salsugineum]ESQ41079.1 hypothetical protein EUTSA_v10012489mg [Eutrema salsugineum]
MDSSFFLTTVAAAIGCFTLLRKLRFHRKDNKEKDSSFSSSPSPSSSLSPSSVPPPSSSRIWTHHVFPSFRGEDVRRDFLSHIQMEFQRNGITPFIDNEIKRGESIGPELIRAIRGSKIAIILLSRNYASSKWCLDELVEIMKCREELGQTVMAIFYKVDPSDVKKLTGDFGRVFRKTCSGKKKEDTERWRQALAKVATIAGYHSNNWDNEVAMIKKIATDISNMLNNSISSSDFDGLVGMRAHLEKMEPLLCLESDEVRMIGIWGPPGIGKTTIARVVYHQLSNSFQLSVFMENIKANYTRPCSDDYSTKLQLQQQFMSRITNHKDMEVSHLGVVPNRLKDKKVLVVLDGVDQLVQLDAMAKETWWFGPGSRIIITAQDQSLFRAHGISHIYKVDFPETDEALQIFCMYAFGQKSPKDGFEELAWEVTKLVGKLPLGLRVMGSYFRGMSKQEWKSSIPKLKSSLSPDIQSILKFSYDALDEEDKDLFLHIACFFNHAEIERMEAYLGKKFLEVRQRLNVLAEKSLISIEWRKNWRRSGHSYWIDMHSLLGQLGKDIVRKQSIDEPGQRRFLVDKRDISEVLTDDAAGGKSVIGINCYCNSGDIDIDISERAFERMTNLQFLRLDIHTFWGSSARGPGRNKLHLPRGLKYISRKLRFLEWRYFPMKCLPSVVNVEFLVELILADSQLEKLWEGVKSLRNLKWMDLSNSVYLKELPDLSTVTNLKTLYLNGCYSLVKLPSTNGYTYNLQDLILTNCSSLTKLPSSIGHATNLQRLNLRRCSSLLELPASIGNATNLKDLILNYCSSLVELPASIGNATNLTVLNLERCSSLLELPASIGNATNLTDLNLEHCSSLVELPSSIGNATNLTDLNLRYCSSLVELPSSIGNLHKLEKLRLKGCCKLEVLPTNINLESLEVLDLTDCSMLKSFPEISTNVKRLRLSGTAIEQVPPSIRSWPRLADFSMSYFENLKELPHALERITRLDLSNTEIQELSLPQFTDSFSTLDAENCESLERLDFSFLNPRIRLNFGNCFKLNQEARDLIIQSRGEAVLPGRQVPPYFTHRTTSGNSLTIKLKERPLPKSMRFKACILLVYKGDDNEYSPDDYFHLTYREGTKPIKPVLTEHLYTFEFEAKVTSSELVFEFQMERIDVPSDNNGWKVEACGLLQLLEVP